MHNKLMTGVALAVALALYGGSAFAVDQIVLGKKLLILNPPSGTANNKVVFLSKEPTTAIPGAVAEDPRCVVDGGSGAGGVLVVNSTTSGESFIISLPCANWSLASGAYKYKDTTGATCKNVLVKAGKLVKAICKGTQVDYDLGGGQAVVRVKIRTGTAPRQWCSDFFSPACQIVKDGSDDKKYLSKNCTSSLGSCVDSPSGAFIEVASLF